MRYINHDFYSNFNGSVASGDKDMYFDMFINEISDLVVFETPKIVNALNKSGIKTSLKDSDEEIVDKTLSGLNNNTKLISALAFIIAESNKLINNPKGNKEEWARIVQKLKSNIGTISKEFDSKKEIRDSIKSSIMAGIESKAKEKGNYTRTIWKRKINVKKTIIVLGVLTLITISTVLIVKGVRRRRSEKMAMDNTLPLDQLDQLSQVNTNNGQFTNVSQNSIQAQQQPIQMQQQPIQMQQQPVQMQQPMMQQQPLQNVA